MLIFGPKRLLSLKNCQMRPQNNFSRFSLKIQLFSKKLLNEKILKTSFPIKKVIFIFVARRLLPFKRDLGPKNGFLAFSQKITPFFEKITK